MIKVGIIFPMKEELDAIREYCNIKNTYNIFDLTFYEGVINNVECVFVECGVGKVNAARTAQILIDNVKVDYIFNIGVAGGVSDKLHVGDIIIGTKLVQHDFDITAFDHEKGYIPNIGTYIETDDYLRNLAIQLLNDELDDTVHTGIIASGDIFCTESKMSNKIASKFNALCVEMEGASIAQICYLSHIPFLVIRSISDVPNDNNVVTYEDFLELSSKKIANCMNGLLGKIYEDNL